MGFYKEIGGNGVKWIKLVFLFPPPIKSVGFLIHDVPPREWNLCAAWGKVRGRCGRIW